MKFKSGDLVMLISTSGVPTEALKGLAIGHVGEVSHFCSICTLRAMLLASSDQLYYHVKFGVGNYACPENTLKKIGDDPDAKTIETEEEVAA